MNRRTFVIGASAGTGLVGSETFPAHPSDITESPLFYVQPAAGFCLECRPDVEHLRIVRYDPGADTLVACPTLLAAERHVLDLAADWRGEDAWSKQLRNPDGLVVCIVRASHQIAYQSRRGAGNHVLLHPAMIQRLDSRWFESKTPEAIGRWTEIGTIIGNIRVLVSEQIDQQEVVVFYRGSMDTGRKMADGPAMVFRADRFWLKTGASKLCKFRTQYES